MADSFDIVIVGGGMAGLSLGAEAAALGRVLVLEREAQPGYHATGRSVAFWTESYGGPAVQPLTSASGPLLAAMAQENAQEEGGAPGALLRQRGALHIARTADAALADAMLASFAGSGVVLAPVGRLLLERTLPGLRPDWTCGVAEPSCADIDAAALLDVYRRRLLAAGGTIRCDTAVLSARRSGEGWAVETSAGTVVCGTLVNAAGAWADEVASHCGVLPIGIRPLRRNVVQLRLDREVSADLPLVLDLAGGFYFKSVGPGRLWLTPHDEVPDVPGDAAPDELSVAVAIDRMQQAVDWPVAAVERKWAGLRSFAPDRAPVYGFDPAEPRFFWFAGQGGFGIQTAPAAARVGAALLAGEALPPLSAPIDPHRYAPGRFRA